MLDLRDVVLEDCGYVSLSRESAIVAIERKFSECTYLREYSLAVADQKARLSASTVSDHDELLAVLRRRRDVCARAARGSRVHCAVGSPGAPSVVAVGTCVVGAGVAVLAMDIVVILHG